MNRLAGPVVFAQTLPMYSLLEINVLLETFISYKEK